MTPEEYWARVEAEKAAAEPTARYLAWLRERRRARRRRIATIALGAALSGAGVTMVIVSVSSVRGAKTAHPAGSTLPPVAIEPAQPVRSADQGADAVLSQRSQVAVEHSTRQGAGTSPAPLVHPRQTTGASTVDRPVRDSHREGRLPQTAHESASPSVREQPTASSRPERRVAAAVAARRNEPAIPTPMLSDNNATTRVQRAPLDPAIGRRVTSSVPTAPIDRDTRSNATSPRRLDPAATMPERVPLESPPPATAPPSAPPDRWHAAVALVDRLKQATALTPAEARRLEKVKTALGNVPEVWLTKRVIGWVKSARTDIDPDPTIARSERPSEAP
jgi:hypothetical protein